MRKVPTTIQLDQGDRDRLERLMAQWHLSLSGAVRKLIQDYPEDIISSHLTAALPAAPPEPLTPSPAKKTIFFSDPSDWEK